MVNSNIPKYFIVKRDTTSHWNKYIDWLNKTYSLQYGGDGYDYYGHDGSLSNNGTNCHMSAKNFKNNPTSFTAKQFMQLMELPKIHELW